MMKKVGIFVLCACFMSSMTVNASGVTAREVQESTQGEAEESAKVEQKESDSSESNASAGKESSSSSEEKESESGEPASKETPESESKESTDNASDSKESETVKDETKESETQTPESGEGESGETESGETDATDETDETAETDETLETEETEETEEVQLVEIPDVTGMNYQDADAVLAEFSIEVIHTFTYSNEIQEDLVLSQSVSGSVDITELHEITLEISAGPEKIKSTDDEVISIDGDFSDWSDKPYSWEYGYDNSNEVWNGWFYVDGKAEQCDKGTFNNNVRHKIGLYCDGENVYVYVQLATAYQSGFDGIDYEFTIDGQKAAFQLFTNGAANNGPGVYDVDVRNRNGSEGYTLAEGAESKLLVHDNGKNNELEVKIPLSTLQLQNSNIDIENVGNIQFWASHLMYRPVSASGADTSPYAGAALAFLLVPSSTLLLKKYPRKKRG